MMTLSIEHPKHIFSTINQMKPLIYQNQNQKDLQTKILLFTAGKWRNNKIYLGDKMTICFDIFLD